MTSKTATITAATLAALAVAAPASGATLMDLGSKTYTQTNANGYVIKVTGKDPIVKGGVINGKLDAKLDWRNFKGPNGAGVYFGKGRVSGNARVEGTKMTDVGTDGFRVATGLDSLTIDGVTVNRASDDVFSLARKSGTKIVIKNSKVRGYAILSSRNTGDGANLPYSLEIDGLVAENIPYTIGDPKRRVGNVFKLDAFRGTPSTWKIKNSVFLVPDGAGMDAPNATWDNVTFVYSGKSFPFWNGGKTLPKGVTITKDMNAYKQAMAK